MMFVVFPQLCGSSNELMTLTEEKMGFIMMECGFERVSFKVQYYLFLETLLFMLSCSTIYYSFSPQLVKRSKFEKNENPSAKENTTDVNINKASAVPPSEGLSADLTKYNIDHELNKNAGL